jgi:hypothetical protein
MGKDIKKKPPGKMGQPITMPGVWGALARAMGGVLALTTRTGIPERTIRAWARNERSMDALGASKIADLCDAMGVAPILYEDEKGNAIGCTPYDGWVVFPKGWESRTRLVGTPSTKWPVACPAAHRHARESGWPY